MDLHTIQYPAGSTDTKRPGRWREPKCDSFKGDPSPRNEMFYYRGDLLYAVRVPGDYKALHYQEAYEPEVPSLTPEL